MHVHVCCVLLSASFVVILMGTTLTEGTRRLTFESSRWEEVTKNLVVEDEFDEHFQECMRTFNICKEQQDYCDDCVDACNRAADYADDVSVMGSLRSLANQCLTGEFTDFPGFAQRAVKWVVTATFPCSAN